jgi:AraC-like DNA-binding protein
MRQRTLPLTVRPYRRDRLLVQRVRQGLVSHLAQSHSAEAVGFQNDKSFIRAFRGWTATTPADFRRAGSNPPSVHSFCG